jgi:hypothetical protein
MQEQRGLVMRTCTSSDFPICISSVLQKTNQRNVLYHPPTVEQVEEYVTGTIDVWLQTKEQTTLRRNDRRMVEDEGTE